MSVYTCNSCGLGFSLSEDQRSHMKSGWHRYNLKRRVANLPSIDEATFNNKVATLKPAEDKDVSKRELRRREKEALLEKKKRILELARENMLKSMHNDNISPGDVTPTQEAESIRSELLSTNGVEGESTNLGGPAVEHNEISAEEEHELLMAAKLKNKVDIPLETCLFCSKRSFKTFEQNLGHMFKSHGFYIPEEKYLVDKEGMVKYLSEKIGIGNLCLCCSYQGRSLEAVRAHMLAKSHCRVPYESEDEQLEISEFYDFTSSYAALDTATNSDENEWEDIEEEGLASEDDDEVLQQEVLYHDGAELHLPTGMKVGHRSLQRYYRQNLKPERQLSEGQGTVIAADTRHLATLADRKQLAMQKRTWKTLVKDKRRDDKRAAKFLNNQPYYRDQLLQ
ncbi:Rei1p Ecym_6287 [Eremothecium cymbalariae DBVPG|uniref:C2H2-type domain-containing protein n=1 Tax=Eremothecium cymbalariae (strain CBS 270.75 / DBVPG 7215 / KCTC 17166 / NRRL Y-17582) TaxID=931890 RepID=G8JVI8_ERECY|nr:hypothetical protein Ecym_6287 [Eremothecium cymbalariae DBVPG\